MTSTETYKASTEVTNTEVENTLVSYYSNVFNTTSDKKVSLNEIFETIKSDKYFEITKKIREIQSSSLPKEEKDKCIKPLKLSIESVTFSGVFNERKKTSLVKSTGIAVIDMDSYGNIDTIKWLKEEIKKMSFVLFSFISPSGGLKIGCKIPFVNNYSEYEQVYISLSKEFYKFKDFLTEKLDEKTKDISRLCFLSYDPELYFNNLASEYPFKIIPVNIQQPTVINNYVDKVDRSEIEFNEVKNLIKKHWTKDKIFNYMLDNFSKWNEKTDAYREATYLKAYQKSLDERNEKPEKILIDESEEESEELNDDFKQSIITMLLKKKQKIATEKIANMFKKLYKTYSIKNDDSREIYVYKDGIFVPNGISEIKEFVRNVIGVEYSAQFTNQIIEKIEVDSFVDADEFFNAENKFEICVQNGILNIITKQLSSFTPEKVFFNKLPVEFRPGITPLKAIHFIKEIVKTEKDYLILQELFGYSLYKDYQIEKAVMFTGRGRNGKSQLLTLLKNFVGAYNCSALKLENLMGKFDTADLHKKLINIAGDINGGLIEDTSMLKNLTGKDPISADRKFKSKVYFLNYAKLLFSANELPYFKDNSDGFWDRWILIDFPFRFEYEDEFDSESNKEYKEKGLLKKRCNDVISVILEDNIEMAGVLNWALEGLDRLLKNQKYTKNDYSMNISRFWDRKANSFKAFCDENIKAAEDFDSFIIKIDVKKKYLEYCKQHNIKNPQTDSKIKFYLENEFGAEIKQKMLKNSGLFDSSDVVRVWTNIEWKK